MKSVLLISLLLLTVCCAPNDEQMPGICLSFDDRTINEWYAMMPLLERYGARVTFFVTQPDSLRPEEVVKLKAIAGYGHEIGSHGALHVNAEAYIREHGYISYLRDEVDGGIAAMQRIGFDPVSFAYPYGARNWFTDLLLFRRFDCVRSVSPLGMEITHLDEIYYRFDANKELSAVGIDAGSGLTQQMVIDAVGRAKERKEVVMLYGHEPSATTRSAYEFDPAFLEFILEECQKEGLQFYTFRELSAR